MEKVINLELSVSKVNVILSALAERPCKDVYDLVTFIKGSAEAQLASQQEGSEPDGDQG